MTAKGARTFQLPMTSPLLITTFRDSGRATAHALDFDVVCEAENADAALQKLSVALKAYIEYGLGNDLVDQMLYPSPKECWDQWEAAVPSGKSVPIRIDHNPLVLIHAMLNEAHRTSCQTATH